MIDVRGSGAGAAARDALQTALSERREIEVAPDPARVATPGSCPASDPVAPILAGYDPEGGRPLLEQALRAELRCEGARGQRAAAGLRALGVDPGADHPEIDALSNVARQPLSVTTEPPGARVWIDFREADSGPVERLVGAGPHWVSAAAPGRAPRSARVDVSDAKPAAVALALPEITVTAEGIAQRMVDMEIGVAVVWNGERAQIWALTAKGTAQLVEEVSPAQPASVAAAAARVATGGKSEPAKQEKSWFAKNWWLYAAGLGAAGLALGVVLLAENAGKSQRIEVTWP